MLDVGLDKSDSFNVVQLLTLRFYLDFGQFLLISSRRMNSPDSLVSANAANYAKKVTRSRTACSVYSIGKLSVPFKVAELVQL